MIGGQSNRNTPGDRFKRFNAHAELIAHTNVLPVARFAFINGLCWYRALAVTAIQGCIEQL